MELALGENADDLLQQRDFHEGSIERAVGFADAGQITRGIVFRAIHREFRLPLVHILQEQPWLLHPTNTAGC